MVLGTTCWKACHCQRDRGSRTWEGLIGGRYPQAKLERSGDAGRLPFSLWQSALMSIAVAMMGFAGGMTIRYQARPRC
ncbi:MAG: hypothetical protein U0905_15205 [Pirellulales bacterium]